MRYADDTKEKRYLWEDLPVLEMELLERFSGA